MNIFRTTAPNAPETRRTADQTVPEASPEQRAQSPVGSGPTKADEIVRLMAERRNRLKKTL
jgi:hypothetical protein